MIRKFFLFLAVLIGGALFFVSMVLFAIPALQESTVILPKIAETGIENNNQLAADRSSLEKDINNLQAKLDKYTPTDGYIVVNTTENRFSLYKGKTLIRKGVCSTGKNERLIVEGKKKAYTFYTPFGVRTVHSKQPHPVWAKPDWAYIEDGLPIPPPGDPSRFESGTLGAYKLVLGDGYMIHGTIYKRFIGQSVTHGCIRLLDDDLEAVYKTLEIGSKVYIY